MCFFTVDTASKISIQHFLLYHKNNSSVFKSGEPLVSSNRLSFWDDSVGISLRYQEVPPPQERRFGKSCARADRSYVVYTQALINEQN